MMNDKQILTIASDIGYLLLKSGAEVYRAEQSIEYICKSYGIEHVDVFAIPSSLVVTISSKENFVTKTRRVSDIEINLEKASKLNELSRYICEKQPEYEEIQIKIKEIEQIKPYTSLYKTIAFALVGFSFTILFGGTFLEGSIGGVLGILISGLFLVAAKRKMNGFLKNALCSYIISIIAIGGEIATSGMINSSNIIAGTLMILVPGLALTNCMRDYMAQDFMSGTSKLTEALMIALSIALGVSIALLSVYGGGVL